MKSAGLTLASLLIALLLVEAGLRLAGHEPWRPRPMVAEMPRMSDADAQLGWISRPGTYRYLHMDRSIQTTIQPDGARGRNREDGPKPEIWFFGGSFTQGWGLDDGQELTARISQHAPEWTIRNFAVPGYSTLQAQLLYERIVEQPGPRPRLVVYGFADFHGLRNTAAPGWIIGLRRIAGENEWIALPYARWNPATGLRTFPPKSFTSWPLSNYSALLRLLNIRVAVLGNATGAEEQREVTLELIERFAQGAEREGSEFLTMILSARPRIADSLPAELESRNVSHLACLDTGFPSPETALPDDHPNELVSERWAECFLEWLGTRQASR